MFLSVDESRLWNFHGVFSNEFQRRVYRRSCVRGRRDGESGRRGIRPVIVQTFRGKIRLPGLRITQPDGPVFGQQTHDRRTKWKAKGAADRIGSRITGCPAARSEKNDLLTLCVMAGGHEIRARIEIDDRGVTSPLVSHSLSQFFFSFFISKSTGAEKRFRL